MATNFRSTVATDFHSTVTLLTFAQPLLLSFTYLDKVTGVGTGDERGKFSLDITKCREALAQTQVCSSTFSVNVMMTDDQ